MRRRGFLGWVLAEVALIGRRRMGAQSGPLSAAELATLGALAQAVLPESLGPAGHGRVNDDFVRWLAGYQEGADMGHGYGATRLRESGPSPAPRYATELEELDAAARQRGEPFARLAVADRRTLVARVLERAGVTALPGRPGSRHVAADLMAFYFNGSEANDLCYEAAIGRDLCRGLPESSDRPAHLEPRA